MESTVYGVSVPFNEGRIGMACIVVQPNQKMEWKNLFAHLDKQLPSYAQPFFIRITTEIQKTSTFKYTKTELVKQGFNPSLVRKQNSFLVIGN